MRRVYNLIMLCILLICQQYIVAQSYYLGEQKQSFSYNTLYANHAQKTINNNEIINNNKTINTQPAQKKITNQNEQKVIESHKQIIQLINNSADQSAFSSIVMDVYIKIYQSKSQENILNLQKIQYVVISHLNSQGTAFPQIEKQLNNASSMEEEVQIFLSYYKE